jgi:nicotinate-nucleotide adenylyltransferase
MKIGLFFGSFNPIHIGHLAIANYFSEFSDLDQVWLVVSPQNPLKKKKSLLPEYHRYYMAELALGDDFDIRPSNIEFTLPKPSYTVDTLTYLKEKHPQKEFALILGSDNLVSLHKWKNYEELLKQAQLYVYPRPGTKAENFKDHYKMQIVNAPLIEISSSFIRSSIKQGMDIRYFLPPKVYSYIKEMNFYEKE